MRDGFTVEKILFESRPRHYVTGALFLPDEKKFTPPYPGVLVVCGHSANGKAYDMYQRATALLALHGIAGLIIDPIGQGERLQIVGEDGRPLNVGSTTEHSLLGLGSILLGRNTAQFEIWDGMRAIDYLESRDDVDTSQGVGCMGNSGGGTQTAYLMALDERIVCASPSCYITSLEKLLHTIGPQDAEQNIAGQIAFGMNHADYIIMRAPRPTLLCVATQDYFSIEGAWDSFRQAKRVYTRLGHGLRVDLAENDDKHGYRQPLREAAASWMVRWLRGEDKVVREPEIDVLSDKEIQASPRGQVMLIDGAVSAFDLNIAENRRLAAVRKRLWEETPREEALSKVRRIAGIGQPHTSATSELKPRKTDRSYGVDACIIRSDVTLPIPALLLRPEKQISDKPLIVYADAVGKSEAARIGGPAHKLVSQGHTVLAIDVRGVGETASRNGSWYNKRFGSEGKNATMAYLLGRSLLGLRAEDILAAASAARQLSDSKQGIALIATGELGPPALHAAALESELFHSVRLENSLVSFTRLVETPVTENQWVHIVHGALRTYDLPDLAATLGDKLTLVDPVDASGKPAKGH